MDYVKPFLAGSFGVAALIRGGATILMDLGALSFLESIGAASLSMFGVIGLSMVGGALIAWKAAKHPFSRSKKA